MNDVLEGSLQGHKLGAYAGYVDPQMDVAVAQEAYWKGNLPQLRRIKKEIDPMDLFHNLQSVRPAA